MTINQIQALLAAGVARDQIVKAEFSCRIMNIHRSIDISLQRAHDQSNGINDHVKLQAQYLDGNVMSLKRPAPTKFARD